MTHDAVRMKTSFCQTRHEYPRPDRQRGFIQGVDWLNLNGPWEFRFDGEREGESKGWHEPHPERWEEQIVVPFCWESLAAWGQADSAGNDHFFSTRPYRHPLSVTALNHRGSERYEVGWYRRQVQIPDNEHWQGKRVILTIGAADFRTEAWCNGQRMGAHEGGYTPFEFDLTDHLVMNEAGIWQGWIVLRVEDVMDNREQPVGKQWGWYTSTSGIWQTVFVEPRPAAYVERFEVRADLTNEEILLRVFLTESGPLLIEITTPLGEKISVREPGKRGVLETTIGLAPAILWDPNNPRLYRIRLTLGTDVPDVVHGYFGMRSLVAAPASGSAPAALIFNGKPIYLRGALYQSYHADGVYTATDVTVLRNDIAEARRNGFDFLRIHIKIDDPLFLYEADVAGMLLMADFPNFGEGGNTALGRVRFEKMMRDAIARDFNHPSIITWCLFNETWGFGGQADFVNAINQENPPLITEVRAPGTKIANADAWPWIDEMWKVAKSLDPTRLIEDMSVVAWDHLERYGHGDTDINSWHFYTHDYYHAHRHIADVVRETYAGSTYNYGSGFTQGSQPLINSEYGGVGALDGDVDVSWSFKFLTNELRLHGSLSAYIYTELHDVEWERNGLLNYDRTPKDFGYEPTLVNQGDVLPIDYPPISRHDAGSEVELDIYSSHFSWSKYESITLHWRLTGVDSLGWAEDALLVGLQPMAFPPHEVKLAARLKLTLPKKTMLTTLCVAALTDCGKMVAQNYIQFYSSSEHPESLPGRRIMRLETTDWSDSQWSEGQSSREDAKRQGFCFGRNTGWFEWSIPTEGWPEKLYRVRFFCEASSRREDLAQTDAEVRASSYQLLINGVEVNHGVLPNHPHDARGVLSYLHGERGAYGYLIDVTIEGELLGNVISAAQGHWVLHFGVPAEGLTNGGATLYGGESGRYPFPPTIIVE